MTNNSLCESQHTTDSFLCSWSHVFVGSGSQLGTYIYLKSTRTQQEGSCVLTEYWSEQRILETRIGSRHHTTFARTWTLWLSSWVMEGYVGPTSVPSAGSRNQWDPQLRGLHLYSQNLSLQPCPGVQVLFCPLTDFRLFSAPHTWCDSWSTPEQ